ncbi:MAG TPA: ABC transporter permease [Candidatus Faecalibacterium gallistercoris]|uniref:ABC transporter permease n=1 Tax=Candidatus Faecalibacterium gallistercoris TaxID=2838579 RepID=A0A9D2JLX4_9FIRM|nr:ABC transporter permease [Candidatus Faecalibacterium gallistercoris]
MLYETVRQALKNIASNKFRTLLTMLGIIIGIMAVMIIVGLGNGLTQSMRASVSSMGMNLLQVNVFGPRARNVSVDEMYRITEERPDLFSGISPMVSMDRTSSAVRVGTKNYSQTSVIGISETYAGMTGTKIAEGRGIQYVDCAEYKRVCVVGDYIARVAYGGNAIGQTLKLGPDQFTIIGVAAAEVSDPSLQEGSSDDYVYIPYTTAQRVARSSNVSAYGVTTVTEAQVAEGKAVLEAGLQELTHSEDSYFVTSLSEVLNTFSSMIGMVVSVLTVIAAISLLVGGIGIMNIMMVSVAERTREIGIRKALGAKERTILALFVTEAATTSALGGLIGIILGYGVSAAASPLVAAVMGDTNMTISPSAGSVAVAFGVSVGIGILFGYLPAKRAARLNPIEALRYD